ncbi:maturation of Asn-linked oligosaccharides protein [Apophysomyces sp. BC1034]|nr:maturation of Asn-linked oligosaccharides protein [Apophysomyces sp. BC1015]KAG0172022.1 maturation of Asn-linked oligosaccharides protein [Apophysomyces sp. BC1021]KAG0185007.1 maturation of Asn-linked oligosaccharides protein [Apophysomyces sp. BC1034]
MSPYFASLILSFTALILQAGLTGAAPTSQQWLKSCTSSNERSEAVKGAFSHAYGGYKKYAWGHDELLPVTRNYSDSRNGWGATIVDALDTMLIMGFDDDYAEALKFVSTIDFSNSSQPAKGFETNIRYLGGLLSANDLRPDPILAKKAIEVTEAVLLPLFDSPSKAPYTDMDLNAGKPKKVSAIDLAEFGTYSLEFTRLSQITNNPKYAKFSNDLIDRAISVPTEFPGLFPTTWTVNPFEPVDSSVITIGSGGDSFYEYLMKNYILLGGSDKKLLETWMDTVESTQKYLLSPTKQDPNVQFVAMINDDTKLYQSDELICFWPGNIMLGTSQVQNNSNLINFATTFMNACETVWKDTATGIAPETWTWSPKTKSETESLIKTEVAWDMFRAIHKYTRTAAGYSLINDVDDTSTTKGNLQESFFLAETLKYLYLIFVDKDCVSLDEYVFNTEAHPFKLPHPIKAQH